LLRLAPNDETAWHPRSDVLRVAVLRFLASCSRQFRRFFAWCGGGFDRILFSGRVRHRLRSSAEARSSGGVWVDALRARSANGPLAGSRPPDWTALVSSRAVEVFRLLLAAISAAQSAPRRAAQRADRAERRWAADLDRTRAEARACSSVVASEARTNACGMGLETRPWLTAARESLSLIAGRGAGRIVESRGRPARSPKLDVPAGTASWKRRRGSRKGKNGSGASAATAAWARMLGAWRRRARTLFQASGARTAGRDGLIQEGRGRDSGRRRGKKRLEGRARGARAKARRVRESSAKGKGKE